MKTTIDIPEQALADAIRFTGAQTKREAVVIALEDFNRRHRMAGLVKLRGSAPGMITAEELRKSRRRD